MAADASVRRSASGEVGWMGEGEGVEGPGDGRMRRTSASHAAIGAGACTAAVRGLSGDALPAAHSATVAGAMRWRKAALALPPGLAVSEHRGGNMAASLMLYSFSRGRSIHKARSMKTVC